MKTPTVCLFLTNLELSEWEINERLMSVRTDNVLSPAEWSLHYILEKINSPEINCPLIILDKTGFFKLLQAFKLEPKSKPEQVSVINQEGDICIVGSDKEVIIPRDLLGVARKLRDGTVQIWERSDQEVIETLGGNLARNFWKYATQNTTVTICGDLEEWQLDLSDLDYEELTWLVCLIMVFQSEQQSDIDSVLADNPENFYVQHVKKLSKLDRSKLLSDVSQAFVKLTLQEEVKLP